jgi:hypothetical protein
VHALADRGVAGRRADRGQQPTVGAVLVIARAADADRVVPLHEVELPAESPLERDVVGIEPRDVGNALLERVLEPGIQGVGDTLMRRQPDHVNVEGRQRREANGRFAAVVDDQHLQQPGLGEQRAEGPLQLGLAVPDGDEDRDRLVARVRHDGETL